MKLLIDKVGRLCEPPIHKWFGLSYSSYFTIPRSALQSMPLEWQEQFITLMNEAEKLGIQTPDNYEVRRRDEDGKYMSDPWANYRHPDYSLMPVIS